MVKHQYEENYKDKTGETWALRCTKCFRKWKTSPKSNNCKGSPAKQAGNESKSSEKPVGFHLFGEAFRIAQKYEPHKAKGILERYHKNAIPNKEERQFKRGLIDEKGNVKALHSRKRYLL